jgi:hypothetical protein
MALVEPFARSLTTTPGRRGVLDPDAGRATSSSDGETGRDAARDSGGGRPQGAQAPEATNRRRSAACATGRIKSGRNSCPWAVPHATVVLGQTTVLDIAAPSRLCILAAHRRYRSKRLLATSRNRRSRRRASMRIVELPGVWVRPCSKTRSAGRRSSTGARPNVLRTTNAKPRAALG